MKTRSEIIKMLNDARGGAWEISMGLVFMFCFLGFPIIFMIWGGAYIIGIILCGGIIFGEVQNMNFWEKAGVFAGVIGTTYIYCYLMGRGINR